MDDSEFSSWDYAGYDGFKIKDKDQKVKDEYKKCPECKGNKNITLFISVVPCDKCEGKGKIKNQ